jgi:hypothetical protein
VALKYSETGRAGWWTGWRRLTPRQVKIFYLRSRIFPVPPSPREDDTVDHAGEHEALRSAELQMLAEATRAAVAAFTAVQRMREADRALDGLQRASWGAEVQQWHEAAEALSEALAAVEAYREFEPTAWWGSWR